MNEILGMLRDALGIKPLIPALLIVLLGMAFLTVRRYPTHELIYDRWFLVSVIVVICGSLAYAILAQVWRNGRQAGGLAYTWLDLRTIPIAQPTYGCLRAFRRIWS